MAGSTRTPSVLVPFSSPDPEPGTLDFFLYLRPETNGVDVESVIFSVVRSRREAIRLTYLANIPGEFVTAHDIVERHYAVRAAFARRGGAAFTVPMRRALSTATGVAWDSLDVVGAYDALDRLGVTPEELFATRVPASDVFEISGQVVKRIKGVYVVNYDIPALLHRDRTGTDIAVMCIRAHLDYPAFFSLVAEIRHDLVEKQLFNPDLDLSRAVHVSRGPVEQLADARDYLVDTDGQPLGVMWSPFARFLSRHGVPDAVIAGFPDHPIAVVEDGTGGREVNLATATWGLDYDGAYDLLSAVSYQCIVGAYS